MGLSLVGARIERTCNGYFLRLRIPKRGKDNIGWVSSLGYVVIQPFIMANYSLYWTVIVIFMVSGSCGNPDAKRLYDDLLSNYNKLVRPVVNVTDAVTVKLKLKLSQLIDVNLRNQIMTTNLWVEQFWYDYKMRRDPNEYGGVNMLHVPSDHIWRPDIVLYNNADGNFEVTLSTKATLYHSGRVEWKPPAIYHSSCEMDVEYFPFDEQTCVMKFGSWTYDGFQVDLRHQEEECTNYKEHECTEYNPIVSIGVDLSEFYMSVEWDILAVPAIRNVKFYPCCDEPYLDITFNITMRRKTLFYTVNLIIPCMGISFLTVLVFYLPSDSGEKVSLSISILLSLTVFFLLLAEIIPPTSLAVPLLGKYLLFTMILVTFSVVVTIGVLNVNFRTPATHKMAPWVRKVFIDFLPRFLFIQRPEPDEEGSVDQEVITAGYNIVFPETLEERNSVSRLLNHAQYDGGGFRLGAPGDQQKSLQLQPQLSLQLDSDRFSFPEKQQNGGALSGYRDSVQEQEPHLEKAINSVR